MILPFSTKWPKNMGDLEGIRNRFPEKIWHSLAPVLNDEEYYKWHGEEGILNLNMGNNYDDSFFNSDPKLHTIRRDEKNRWRAGNKIHPVINNRTKQQFQFTPTIKCTGVQRIEIVKVANVKTPYTRSTGNKTFQVIVDGNCLNKNQIEQLAINDGFESVEHFFRWFNEDFTGKLIHWTDLRY
ncbi:hypothetical protein [Aquimarina macrocephali]|uniref:hypothetical protein n=1 Tax=Aquimarina macrocephali TaxID=666563 RepID=UPI003F672115